MTEQKSETWLAWVEVNGQLEAIEIDRPEAITEGEAYSIAMAEAAFMFDIIELAEATVTLTPIS